MAGTQGEAHKPQFKVRCQKEAIADEFRATASSRRKAEQLVAEKLLAAIEEIS
jgi:ribonuclease-3